MSTLQHEALRSMASENSLQYVSLLDICTLFSGVIQVIAHDKTATKIKIRNSKVLTPCHVPLFTVTPVHFIQLDVIAGVMKLLISKSCLRTVGGQCDRPW